MSTLMQDIMKAKALIDKMGPPPLANPTIHESALLTERYQFRFPKSKKKRIRAKWAKRDENYRVRPMLDKILMTPMGIIAHPETARRLRTAIPEIYSGSLFGIKMPGMEFLRNRDVFAEPEETKGTDSLFKAIFGFPMIP